MHNTRKNKWVEVNEIPLATVAMHPRQSWRDGYNDGVQNRFGNSPYPVDGDSDLYYWDGYNVGSVKRREVERELGLIR